MEKQFTIRYEVVHESALSDAEQKLFQSAVEALEKSYAPYSKFNVGCSVLLENGEVVSGANQEVASYPVCICAEGVALSTVSSMHPNVGIRSMFIVARNENGMVNELIAPCGVCRQRIVEYETRQNSGIQLLLKASGNAVVRFASAKDILPFAFGAAHLPLK